MDIGGNSQTMTAELKYILPVLSYPVQFEASDVRAGNISYRIEIPLLEKSEVEKLELFGRKGRDGFYESYGVTKEEGVIKLEQGCYEFIAVGCLKGNVCGSVDGGTKICVYNKPEITLNFIKSFDIYSDTKKLEFDYQITNYKEGRLSYSLDGKQYQFYSKIEKEGKISFSLKEPYEGIVYFQIEAENILGDTAVKVFQVNYDNVSPKIDYVWDTLRLTVYPLNFRDVLRVRCADRYLPAKPLKIYYRIKEGDEFTLLEQSGSEFSYKFNFSNIEKVQFKFYCADAGNNYTVVETPFYTLDNTPPLIAAKCKFAIKKAIGKLNITYEVTDKQSKIEQINVSLYKNNNFHNLLYSGTETLKEFDIDIAEEGRYEVEIFARDGVGNSSVVKTNECIFEVDLTPPHIKMNLPSRMKYPHDKVLEFPYQIDDNNNVKKVELYEKISDSDVLLATSTTSTGIFKILPENREITRNFYLIAYDSSENISTQSFSVIYKQLKLSYDILNEPYITNNLFEVQYNLTDDLDLLQDVLLFYKTSQSNDFIKYGSVLKDKNILLPDGCYIFSIIGISRFKEEGDKNKSAKKLCIITKRPSIEIPTGETVFYGREFVRIPFKIISDEIDEDSIKIWWSSDKGITWHRIDRRFHRDDEVFLHPASQGQFYIKVYAKNRGGFENELIIKNIFISTKPPICKVMDNLQFTKKKISFGYEIDEKYIPTREINITIYTNNKEIKKITKTTSTGIVEVELEEGIYRADCTV
ncbi:MAG: hypothetical protein ACK4NF_06515, partial [Planctomycetota bacterium]